VSSESLVGFLGEFPPDTEEQYLPEHMVSESSAEDDMTLGPDPDSIDAPHLSHLLTLPSHDSSIPGASSPQPLTSAGMQVDPSITPYHNGVIATPMNASSSYMNHAMESYDLPHPSARVKRSSPGQGSMESLLGPSAPNQPVLLNSSSSSITSDSSYPGSKANTRRRTTTTRAASLSGPVGANAMSSEGYYYRSRDKTNYSQAHKGTLPSPPMTPESQKRIRCTWSLEETRMLFDLLKDTTIETFPDAQHIRAHLLRVDPTCNKTLDHVRNKKANLIQKAHSKNVSVAEILISDMHKLEMEMLGGSSLASRGSGGVYVSSHMPGVFSSSTSNGGAASSSMDTSGSVHQMGTRSSGSQTASGNAALGGMGGPSSAAGQRTANASMPNSSPGTPSGAALTISVPAATSSGKVTSMRPARRRVSKRTSATLLSTMSQPATATAQQLAKVAAAQQAAQQAAALSGSPHEPSSSVSMLSPDGMKVEAHGVGQRPLTPTSASANSLTSLSPSTNSSAHDQAANSPAPVQHNGSPAAATLLPYHLPHAPATLHHTATATLPPQPSPNFSATEFQRWQRWAFEEISKLVAGQNEVRTALRLTPIELSAPPIAVMPTQPLRLPVHSQWISSWQPGTTDSLDSETESSDEHSTGTLLDPSRKVPGSQW
jgi:hypothetical protein